jgi:GDP/UDP-N,N'-diacetylbacillosamine 2-epimerase (hydrolysing)
MEKVLLRLRDHPGLKVQVCVTGMHLLPAYGHTISEIERAGLPICARIAVELEGGDGGAMAMALSAQLAAMVKLWRGQRPSLVMVMGDRGEMLAATLAATHLNIPVVHVHGGERSGTIDEPVRHAISKLAHYHFVATESSRERLVRMGENPAHVFVTGAPGLDGVAGRSRPDRGTLCAEARLDARHPVALVVYHPVLQEADSAGNDMAALLEAVVASGSQVLCLTPNSDAGGKNVRAAIECFEGGPGFRVVTHFDRDRYLSWLGTADVMVGNSSSGIIEAASFGLPVVNVGDRQNGRERNANTVDVPVDTRAIRAAVEAALARGRCAPANVYGDGRAGERIVGLLSTLPLDKPLLQKTNAY